MGAAAGSSQRGNPADARMRIVLPAVLALVLSPALALAQAPAPAGHAPDLSPALQAKLVKRGDLTLSNTPFQQALFTIGQQWDINIVVAEDVQGMVSGTFRQAPLYEILDSILLANGYGYRPVGESFVVMKLETLGDFNPMFVTATVPLKVVKPEDILPSVQTLASPKGKVQAVPSAHSLLVFDFPDRVRLICEFARRLDDAAAMARLSGSGGGFDVFHYVPQYVKAASLKESLTTMLSPEGKLTIIEPENRLVVIDHPDVLVLIRKSTLELDVPRNQVRIAAIIYDVSLEDLEKCGINWNHALKARHDATGVAQSAYSIDSLTQIPAAAGDPTGAMTLMSLSRYFDLTAVIDFLSESENSQLLADPMVIVSDMEDAEIAIVTEIPYQQLTQTQQGGQIGTTDFREAGVKLTVRPQIAADGTVLMDVSPEFSRLRGYTDGQQPQPIIDRRTAKTVVRVLNGQTFVIGGLRQRSDIDNVRGLPYLMDIKFLGIGKLFRSHKTEVKEGELLVFITPIILGPCNPNFPRENAAADHSGSTLEAIPPAGQTPFPTIYPPDQELPPAVSGPEELPPVEPTPAGVESLPLVEPQAQRTAPSPAGAPRPATPSSSGGPRLGTAPRPAPADSSPAGVIDLRPRAMRAPQSPQPPGPPLVGPAQSPVQGPRPPQLPPQQPPQRPRADVVARPNAPKPMFKAPSAPPAPLQAQQPTAPNQAGVIRR